MAYSFRAGELWTPFKHNQSLLGAGGAPSGPAGGDLAGAYPDPTLVDVVTPGSFTNANITIDAKGRVIAAANGVGGGGGAPSGPAGGDLAGTYPNPTLAPIITAGSFTNANITIDAKGRITAASNGSAGGGGSGTVNAGLAGQVGWYAAAGTAISGNAFVTIGANGVVTSSGPAVGGFQIGVAGTNYGVLYGNATNTVLDSGTSPNLLLQTGGVTRGAFTATGLAVTGSVTASGGFTAPNTTAVDLAAASPSLIMGFGNAPITSTLASYILWANSGMPLNQSGQNGTLVITSRDIPGTEVVIAPSNQVVGRFSETGLAVTGGLSATAQVVFGNTSSDYAGQGLLFLRGITKGIRFGTNVNGGYIDGVDNTGITTFQPLAVNGTPLYLQCNGTTVGLVNSTGLGVTGTVAITTTNMGLTLRTGNDANYLATSYGRAGDEFQFGIANGPGSFSNGTVAGDACYVTIGARRHVFSINNQTVGIFSAAGLTFPNSKALMWTDSGGTPHNVLQMYSDDNVYIDNNFVAGKQIIVRAGSGSASFGDSGLFVNGGVSVNAGTFAQGTMYYSASLGLVLGAKTGSTFDFSLYNPAGSINLIGVETGTQNVVISNGVGRFTSTGLTVTGNISANGDITLARPTAPTTGALFFGNTGSKYLYFDGNGFYLTSGLAVTGGISASSGIQTSADIQTSAPGRLVSLGGGNIGNNGIATTGASLGNLELQNNGTGGCWIAYHRTGAWAQYMGLDTDNIMKVGGWSFGAAAYRLILGDTYANIGELRMTGNITAYYSDDRLKTRLGNITHALARVRAMEGFFYEANEVAQTLGYKPVREVGLSAQRMQDVLPEVVAPAPIDEKYLTIRYERVVPLLVEAIKELASEFQAYREAHA